MKTINVQGSFIVLLAIVCSVTAFGQKCATRQDSITNRTIYVLVDKMPTFQGGLDSLKSKINKYLKWPERCSVEGAVYVSFTIETNGQITNKRIKNGISSQKFCDANGEALKVMDYLTEWTVGECDGKKVAVEMAIPIRYSAM